MQIPRHRLQRVDPIWDQRLQSILQHIPRGPCKPWFAQGRWEPDIHGLKDNCGLFPEIRNRCEELRNP